MELPKNNFKKNLINGVHQLGMSSLPMKTYLSKMEILMDLLDPTITKPNQINLEMLLIMMKIIKCIFLKMTIQIMNI